ncbi:MAG: restriction endonuclease subunit S [Saprospiraceae bacterium]|nr:restriction endonuclease subunit S [Saprospiraceae bacterium]
MSRGRKPASFSIGSGWEEIFNRSVGHYLQTIIVELGILDDPNSTIPNNNGESILEKVRIGKVFPKIDPSEIPYKLPKNWFWCRLGEICDYGKSSRAEPKQITASTWVLDLEDIEKDTSKLVSKVRFSERNSLSTKSIFKKGDVLYSKLRPYLDKVIVADEAGVCTTEIIPLNFHTDINPYFLMLALKTKYFLSYVSSVTKGMKMPRLGTNEGRMALIPLPPSLEQNAIVAFLDDLKSHKIKSEGFYFSSEVEQKIVALHNSQLTSSAISTELTHQLTLVQKLRQQLLQEAVQGKLLPQDPSDESASILLQKIKAEKERLAKEKKIKKDKDLPEIKAEEFPFEIPKGWVWCRLGEIGKFTGGGTPSMANADYWNGNIPWVSPKDMWVDIISDSEMKITAKAVAESTANIIPTGSLLIVGRSGILKRKLPVAVNSVDCTVNQDMKVIIPYLLTMNWYLQFLLKGLEKVILRDFVKFGMTVHSLKYQEFELMPIPLPPLAEQHRIVQKLEQLLQVCDTLQASIQESRGYNEQLLQQVLREALKG